jgi:hypothetical protein
MTDRDLLAQIGKLRFRVQELERERETVRNDVLEEARVGAYAACAKYKNIRLIDDIDAAICALRSLKTSRGHME